MTTGEDAQVLVIRSEDDAWRALEDALSQNVNTNIGSVRFDGWPVFRVDVHGRDWHQTVPTRAMPPLLEVQDVLNRAYAQIRYDEPNTRRLTGEERDTLELVVRVDKGSSDLSADIAQQLGHVAQEAFLRMNGVEAVITVISIGLLIAAPVTLKIWLNERRAARRLESQERLSHEETERTKVLANALTQQQQLTSVRDDIQAATSKLLKATRSGDTLRVGDISLESSEAHELAQPERERAKDIELSGRFLIIGNRTDLADGFRVTVKRLADGQELRADVPLELPQLQRDVIQHAEWAKTPVDLVIAGQSLHEKIARATVISAAETGVKQ